ncbi:pilus assembly protein CpaE [Angustibacter sp. McL0619]|uniref:pilus assembly protein CpaE n=1 Tax=Angustibacter sp. McL0619 TaxID=3415676 RepID=UPI003CFB7273
MMTLELAQRLADAGLRWLPKPGDRFCIPNRDMDDDVFVLSDMTVEVHDLPSGRVIGFNGTTEWALDEVAQRDALWIPRESQLRDLLGQRFLRLEAVPDGFAVTVSAADPDDELVRAVDIDAERAYARALLAVLGG